MPIQAFFDDRNLVEKKLANYWGYNTINYFSPAPRYFSPAPALQEFQMMVRRLHEAGIEVILDVVYNHTAEGNHLGPTLSFRGIDNASYYMLAADRRYYFDATGCGNTVNLRHPRVLQMVMDSLRYWVEDCHVDGFRFDLATSLGREYDQFDPNAVFLDAVRQDPVLSRVKLIAEPWDVGPNGYQLGNFPPGWAEWNGRYRDDMRSFWKGDAGELPDFARGILGSADLFDRHGRKPWASVNFVTAHDGFTLADLWSYNQQAQRGERARTTATATTTTGAGTAASRGRPTTRRSSTSATACGAASMATLLLSQGTPMILMGDEVGRTQDGNNNAYCQDNEIAWMKWDGLSERDARLPGIRARPHRAAEALPAASRAELPPRPARSTATAPATWSGSAPTGRRWTAPPGATATPRSSASSSAIRPSACSSWSAPGTIRCPFTLPKDEARRWRLRVDAGRGLIDPPDRTFAGGDTIDLEGRTLLLFSGEEG